MLGSGSTSPPPHLLVALAVVVALGCPANEHSTDASKAEKPRATDEPKTQSPSETAAVEAPEAAGPPHGWSRVELSSVAEDLSGTVDVPPGVEAERRTAERGDADGLQTHVSIVKLGAAELGPLVDIPPRFESAEAMRNFHRNFDEVSTHEFGPDHWAVVQQWRPGECMLHGWSKQAGLSCDVFKAPCDEMKRWVELCGSIRPGDAPNATETTPKSAFESLDPAAAELAMTVARAIARSEAATLIAAAGDDGLTIGEKKLAKAELEAAFEGKPVATVVDPGSSGDPSYQWNAGGASDDPKTATIWFTSGYGEQPYFRIRDIDGAWKLTEFGIEDLGEP